MSRARAGWVLVTVVPVLVVFAVCLANAIAWIGRPFAGFLFLENGIAVSIGRAEWSQARYRGIPFARVLAVDGRPVAGGPDLHAYVSANGEGKSITYTLRKGREIFRLAIPVRAFTVEDFVDVSAPLLGFGLLIVFVSAVVVALRPAAPETRALHVLCLGIGLTMITAPDEWAPYWFTPLYFFAECAVPPAFVQLALSYPQRSALLDRGPAVYAVLYLPFAGLGAALLSAIPDPSLFLPLLYCLYLLIANAALVCLGAVVVGLIDGVRPRKSVALGLAALLSSSLVTGAILATYPLLQRPISPGWLFGPLVLLPLIAGFAFVRFPIPVGQASEGVA